MPFFTHIFEDNVFNIFLMTPGSDSELLEKIQNRNNGNSIEVKETLHVPTLKFNKLVELCQTRKDVWYIANDKWKITADVHEPGEVKRMPGTLMYYQIPELHTVFHKYIDMMTEKFQELQDRYFLRIQIDDFVDKDEDGSELTVTITYFP